MGDLQELFMNCSWAISVHKKFFYSSRETYRNFSWTVHEPSQFIKSSCTAHELGFTSYRSISWTCHGPPQFIKSSCRAHEEVTAWSFYGLVGDNTGFHDPLRCCYMFCNCLYPSFSIIKIINYYHYYYQETFRRCGKFLLLSNNNNNNFKDIPIPKPF